MGRAQLIDRDAVRRSQAWGPALDSLRGELNDRGDKAHAVAGGYAAVYAGRRAAMVFDVVYSRQRTYSTRVLPQVEAFAQTSPAASLAALAETGPGGAWGWRRNEAVAVQQVATILSGYAEAHDLDEDAACKAWAEESDLGLAYALSPVAEVRGIKLALFTYLRMRSGGDDLKPDVRLIKSLRLHGFNVPTPEAAYVVGCVAAADLDVPRLVLDQLLW